MKSGFYKATVNEGYGGLPGDAIQACGFAAVRGMFEDTMMRGFSKLIFAAFFLVVSAGARADFQDAIDAYNSGNYIYAFDEFRALALGGDAAAQYRLGLMYAKGQGIPQDYSQAAVWYLKAAAQDDTRAQFAVAEMYSQGQGVPQDDKVAAKWYIEAAEHGYPKAQYTVGLMYAKGIGIPQDLIQAYKWLSIAGDVATRNKEWIEEKMTPEQIKKAQTQAQEWRAQHK